MQKTQSPLLRLWQLGREHHGGLIAAIFCAVVGVLLGLLPYLSAGHILVALLTGQQDWNFYLLWCMVALGGYLAKTLLYNLALSLSHKATFQILRDIRKMVLSKMPRALILRDNANLYRLHIFFHLFLQMDYAFLLQALASHTKEK